MSEYRPENGAIVVQLDTRERYVIMRYAPGGLEYLQRDPSGNMRWGRKIDATFFFDPHDAEIAKEQAKTAFPRPIEPTPQQEKSQ